MNHPREELLALHAGGDLPMWSAWRVRRHMAACTDCREIVDGYAQMRVEISALPVPEPPANLARMILASVPRSADDRQESRSVGWLGWTAAAAVAALGVVAVLPRIALEDAPQFIVRAPKAPNVEKTPAPSHIITPVILPAVAPAPVAVAKFTTVAAAEEDRDSRYLTALRKTSQDPGRWGNPTVPQLVVGARAELLRGHALPGKVEVVKLPGSPVEIVRAEAFFAEGKLIDPSVEIRNVSSRPIANYELIWTVRDASGNEFRGKIASGKTLAPGARAHLSETIVLEPARKGADTEIATARVFVRSATAADGVWVPERTALAANHLDSIVPLTTPIEQAYNAYLREIQSAHAAHVR